MPAYGLIPDSPWIYGAQRLGRAYKKIGSGQSAKSRVRFSYSFKKVVIYKPQLHAELNTRKGSLWRYMERVGDEMVAGAKLQVGVRTGALRNSIHKRHLGNMSGQYLWIGSTKNYAYLHHEGTRPHLILPKEADGVLIFRKGVRVISTKRVLHPGTKPNRYLSDQLRKPLPR